MEQNAARIIELYLDYVNNYVSVEYFANVQGMSVEDATKLLEVGRYIGYYDESKVRTYAGDK